MSEKTARRARTNGHNALEKLPSIDDLLGVSELAQADAEGLLNMAANKRGIEEMMKDEKLALSDPIPNRRPERTFREQLKLIEDAYARKWKRIDEAGHRANVLEILEQRER